ncbi:hypothetical protein L1987_35939 [Smallanthus sonchifolius]|uniref:Uncharacterized protein n=1 Tax=Smallanthus sonchifolius TaxID=185202 RepID=A0ACB9HCN7_9ASTR|nr:hypothetical protein L1987_35939 [Smallanthus sonchifolius]
MKPPAGFLIPEGKQRLLSPCVTGLPARELVGLKDELSEMQAIASFDHSEQQHIKDSAAAASTLGPKPNTENYALPSWMANQDSSIIDFIFLIHNTTHAWPTQLLDQNVRVQVMNNNRYEFCFQVIQNLPQISTFKAFKA